MSSKINMTGGIPEWFTSKFHDDLYLECQKDESRFGQAVRIETDLMSNEDKRFDMMSEFELQEKTGRNPETPEMDPSTQGRWVDTTPYHNSVLFDVDDDLDIKLSPTGDFVTSFKNAVQRKKDVIIYNAFEAATRSGNKGTSTITWANQDGNVKYTGLNTGRTIAHDTAVGNASASDTGMTTEKIELILEYFANNEVNPNIPIWCAISPRQATNLFGQEEYVNVDYNDTKPLVSGRVLKNWMGINWIVDPLVTLGSQNDVDGNTDVYECWAWAQDAMILGIADSLTIKITEESTRSYSQRVYVHMNMGAMRFDECKVIKVECQ
jgi:hypothetical protein